jgi:hypothetical protein
MNRQFAMVSSFIEKWAVFLVLFCVGVGAQERSVFGDPPVESAKEESIPFRSISNDDYAVFPVNWSPEHRYRVGLIRAVKDYEKIFNAAAFAGNKKPYAPASKMFDEDMLVFVCKVVPAVADVDKELRLEKIVTKGTALEVRFAYRNSAKNSTYQIKATAAAWIPKGNYSSLKFYEGTNLVKEIKLDDKNWAFPE